MALSDAQSLLKVVSYCQSPWGASLGIYMCFEVLLHQDVIPFKKQ